jgi:hypothetical protein
VGPPVLDPVVQEVTKAPSLGLGRGLGSDAGLAELQARLDALQLVHGLGPGVEARGRHPLAVLAPTNLELVASLAY